ncbi:PAPA-1 domain protein [Rhizoctonia solani 123E]|uniref:PAPA-1 domain protein n=1 Tax=Rhizoctonia solani 123E TaxID=1423351 RepID=A0A074RRV6_9AGAM|nr:PAPA-1 domain protein [Rhizoctonia solani 123E]
MPPLGWRKSVDGAKGKKAANQNQTDTTSAFSNPPLVPGLTGFAIEALGVTSLGVAIPTQDQATPAESNEAMDIDDPSTGDSTPAPGGSGMPTGSSSNAEMTPPIRSIKLKLKVKNTRVASPPPERPTGRGRGRGRGRGGRGNRGGRGRGGRGRKIAASPSVSPEEESPVEEPGSPESEESSVMGEGESSRAEFEDAPEQPEEGDTMMDADGEEDADGDIDVDGEAEMDPDAPVDSDEELLLDMDMPDQTILDSDADPEMSMMSISSKRLTARQTAMITGGSEVNHVMLPEATGRKAPKTEAEIALRRSETARKRKHQDAQRLEDEKTETINRLLKKQSARARNKKALETPVNEAAAPGEETAVATIVVNRPRIPCYRWVTSAKEPSSTLSFSVPESTPYLPHDASASLLAASAQPVIRPIATCAISGCTAQRKYRLPGAPNFETGACGMDHLNLLKAV